MAKKSWLLLWIGFVGILLCGCGTDTDESDVQKTKDEILKDIEVDIEDTTYYKLSVEPKNIDTDAVVMELMGAEASFYDEAVLDMSDPEYFRYTLELKEDTYVWEWNRARSDLFFVKVDSTYVGPPNLQEGYELAHDLAQMVDENCSTDIRANVYGTISEDAIVYSFVPRYKMIDFMGNTYISLGSGTTQDGSYMDVTVDSDGVRSATVSNWLQVTGEVEMYVLSDFVDVADIVSLAQEYGKNLIEIDGQDASSYEVCKVQMIYIPIEEKKEIYWIPGYEVFATYEGAETTEEYCTLIDAFNGEIYQWILYRK